MSLNNPAKAAFFTERMGGGPMPVLCAALVRGFGEAGVYCDVLVLATSQESLERYPGVHQVSLRVSRAILAIIPIARYLRRERPDVIFGMSWYFNVIAIWAKHLARVPTKVIMVDHNVTSLEATVEHRFNPRMRLVPWLMRWSYPYGDGVIGVADDIIRDLRDRLRMRLSVPMQTVHNPVDVESVRRIAARPVEETWLPKPGIPFVFTAARLARQKQLDVLLRAFAKVLPHNPEARLVIAGEGAMRAPLEKLCSDLQIARSVVMPGYVTDACRLMARCDVFVLASSWEGCSVALQEAMACGTAVIVNDAPGGSKDLVQNGENGVVVKNADVDALADAITQLLADPARRRQYGRAAALRMQDFDYKLVSGRYLEFYRSLGDGASAPERRA